MDHRNRCWDGCDRSVRVVLLWGLCRTRFLFIENRNGSERLNPSQIGLNQPVKPFCKTSLPFLISDCPGIVWRPFSPCEGRLFKLSIFSSQSFTIEGTSIAIACLCSFLCFRDFEIKQFQQFVQTADFCYLDRVY